MSDSLTPKDGELAASMHDFEAALGARSVTLEAPPLETILAVIDGSNQSAMTAGLAAALAERSGARLHLAHVYAGPADSARDGLLAELVERSGAGGVEARAVSRTPDERPPYEQITALAAELASRTDARLHLAHVYPGPADPGRDGFLAEQAARLEAAGTTVQVVPRVPDERPPYEQIKALAAELEVDLLVVPAPYLEAFETLGSDSVGVTLDAVAAERLERLEVGGRDDEEKIGRAHV